MKMTNNNSANYENLELISIHILKTGGTSFLSILRDIFGDSFFHYKEVDFKPKGIDITVLDEIVPPKCRVMHGHYLYSQIKNIHLNSNAKVITWLRDPVERVISRYFYLMENLRLDPDKPLNYMKDWSLLEFAENELFRNRITKFLEGLDLDDLHFIGFLEDYENDLARINEMLGNKDYRVYHRKNNKEFKSKYTVTQKEKEAIAELNLLDIDLYNRALEIKANKIGTLWQ